MYLTQAAPLVIFLFLFELALFLFKDQLWVAKRNIYVQSIFYILLIFIYRYYSGVAARGFIYFQF